MDGKRHHRKSHKSGGLEGSDNGLPTTVVFDPTTTDSARLKIITKLEALDNAKSDSRITVGHEVETKKNNYVIVREIMKGRMSRVFEVKRSKDSKILAMKAHFPTDTGKATILRHEAHIYHELSVLARNLQKDDIRFLNIHDYGECSDKQFLFLTLGGQSLASFLSDEKVPNFQTALNLSFQMLNVIEQIHTLGFIHCRIRPNTFITGLKTRERFTLFIINFSLARMANPTGTAASQATAIPRNPPEIFDRYAPRCQHFGLPYHRRDDLESWFYICCDLFHPFFLPWSSEKRLKSQQMAELKEKLMKGELYHRYSVMPKPFRAFAGAINETDGKLPNYGFFKESLMEEAKTKNCSFFSPWEFIPVASLPAVPESKSQTRIEFEFNQCIKNPTTFNFGNEKSKTVLPTEELSQPSSDVQIVLPKAGRTKSRSLKSSANSKNTKKSSSLKSSSNSKNTKKVENAKSKENIIVPIMDAVKNDDASAPPSTTSKSEIASTTSATKESMPAEKDTDAVKDGGDSIPPPTTTTTSKPKTSSYCIYFDVKQVVPLQESTISATTKESEHLEKEKNEIKPPSTSDGSSDDDDDDENEEEFKLKSPPRLSEQKSSTGPVLQTIPNKRPSTKEAPTKNPSKKEASKSSTSSGSTGISSSGLTTSTGSGTTATTTSGSGTTGSTTDTSNSKTSSAPSLSTTSTASTAVSGDLKKEPLPSASSSSLSGTPKKDNSRRKKIIATTPASAVSSSSPQPSSPSVPSSLKKSSVRISACSTASLPDFAKPNNSPPKNDSVYFNPTNPALNNNGNNNNVQNGSTFPNLTSPNVRTFQAHKNDSVYFGVPTDAATPANTSGYLKPQKREGNESKECNDKNAIAPKSNASKNDSVYFAPK